MKARPLFDLIGEKSAAEDEVMIRTPDGILYSIKGVERESASDDGEGNATSTGSTLWIEVEEF